MRRLWTDIQPMTIRDARILVTGASGFIGSHVTRACVREGAEVACFLRPNSNPWRLLEALPHVTRYDVDLTNEEDVMAKMETFRPDIIFHLAADTMRKRDLEIYEPQHLTHTVSTLRLIQAALKLPTLPRFVHTGTIEEYGRGSVPFREDQCASPVTPYSLTKLEAVHLAMYAAHEHGLPVVVVRPAMTYGPLKGKGMFIPDFFRAAMTTKEFKMSPGEQTRDIMYVDDLVRGYLALATTERVEGEIFNVGTGVETRMKDLAERLRILCGGDTVIQYGAYPCDPKIETMRCVMDIQKMRDRVSWQPTVGLEEGLARTADWYLNASASYEELWK